MPAILLMRGWRVFFYSDEGQEPIHPRLRREIRKIIFDHFDLIVEEWNRYFGGRHDADH